MYIDFEDHRPETPRVPRVISVREGALLSLVLHGLLVLALVFLPKMSWFQSAVVQPLFREADKVVRFVEVAPRIDKPAPPKPKVDQSDVDRRSATLERVPKPENESPLMRGNTPDKVEGATPERAAGPDAPTPPAAQPPEPPKPNGETAVPLPPRSVGGSLGDALRNLKQYLEKDNYNNPTGGNADQQADIQFDSKGVEFGPWLRRFKAQVEHNWFVPQAAMMFSGHVVFQFYVHKDGRITDLTMVAPSKIESFNLAAHSALRLSNPTMPLPPEYPADRAFFTVTFHYNERDN
jgi:TonB family protein